MYKLNSLPSLPVLFCLNITGPLESNLIAILVAKNTGESTTNATDAIATSKLYEQRKMSIMAIKDIKKW